MRCHLADNGGLMSTSAALFRGDFIPLNRSCCEISLIDPICPFEVSTYYVLCGRFNRVEERSFGIKHNKQVCKSMHLSAVKKKKSCMFQAFPVVKLFWISYHLRSQTSCCSWLSSALSAPTFINCCCAALSSKKLNKWRNQRRLNFFAFL